MEQLPGLTQLPFPLRAAELVGGDGAHEAMARRTRMLLLDLPPAHGQGGQLATQPSQHPPERAVMQRAFVDGRGPRRRLIADSPTSPTDRLAIGLPVVLHVAGGQMQKRWPGVALIRQYESRGNR